MQDKLSSLPKFEVKQFVQLTSDNPLGTDVKSTYHIIEVHHQECPAGVQIWYTCRGHHAKYRERSVTIQLIKFNEVELEEIQPVETKDVDLKQQVVELLRKIADMEGTPMD